MGRYIRYDSKLVLSRKPEISSSSAKLMYYCFYLAEEAEYKSFFVDKEKALNEIKEFNNKSHKDIIWDQFIDNANKMFFLVPNKNMYRKIKVFKKVSKREDEGIEVSLDQSFTRYLYGGDYWMDVDDFFRLPCYSGCYSVYVYERLRYEYVTENSDTVFVKFPNSEILLMSGHVDFSEESVINAYENMMDESYIYTDILRKSSNFKLFAPRAIFSKVVQPAFERINISGMEFLVDFRVMTVPRMKKQITGVMVKLSPSPERKKYTNISAQTVFELGLILKGFNVMEILEVLSANQFNEMLVRSVVEENKGLSKAALYTLLMDKKLLEQTQRRQLILEAEWEKYK
jgi:hypothetical protein